MTPQPEGPGLIPLKGWEQWGGREESVTWFPGSHRCWSCRITSLLKKDNRLPGGTVTPFTPGKGFSESSSLKFGDCCSKESVPLYRPVLQQCLQLLSDDIMCCHQTSRKAELQAAQSLSLILFFLYCIATWSDHFLWLFCTFYALLVCEGEILWLKTKVLLVCVVLHFWEAWKTKEYVCIYVW